MVTLWNSGISIGIGPVGVEGVSSGEIIDIAQSGATGICKEIDWDRISLKLCFLKWGIKNKKYMLNITLMQNAD